MLWIYLSNPFFLLSLLMLSVSCEEVFSTKPEDRGHETMPKATSQEHENLFIDNSEFFKKNGLFLSRSFCLFLNNHSLFTKNIIILRK